MDIIAIYNFCVENWDTFITILAYVISIASLIVKMTPTLKDDTVLKNIIKFLGKYIALNKTIDPKVQKQVNKK